MNFDRHRELCKSVIRHILYSEIRQNVLNSESLAGVLTVAPSTSAIARAAVVDLPLFTLKS